MSNILTTVIISSYSRERLSGILETIDSLEKQTLRPDEILLVVDDDEELLHFFRSHISHETNILNSGGYGLSNARNAGILHAKGDIVFFIDDDAVADSKWLELHVENYVNNNVVGVGGKAITDWDGLRPIWFPEELDWIVGCTYKGYSIEKTFIRNPIGCNMSFRNWVFKKVGLFDTEFGRIGKTLISAEETEFSIRALNMIPNARVIYDPDIKVYHKVSANRASLKYVLKRSYLEGVSKALIKMNVNKKITSEVGVVNNKLKTETDYLKYLIKNALPERMKKIYRYRALSQSIVISLSILMVFLGYLITSIKNVIRL